MRRALEIVLLGDHPAQRRDIGGGFLGRQVGTGDAFGFAEAESIVKADLPPEEAAANVAYLKEMLRGKDAPRTGRGTVPVAALNRPD